MKSGSLKSKSEQRKAEKVAAKEHKRQKQTRKQKPEGGDL
jgi:hypothetical protein